MTPSAATPEWTTGTLHVYLLRIIEDFKTASALEMSSIRAEIAAAMASSEKAITKAESSVDRRFDSIYAEKRFDAANGSRGAMDDQIKTFMPRPEIMRNISNLSEKLELLSARIDKAEGRGIGVTASWAVVMGIVTLISTLVAVVALFRR